MICVAVLRTSGYPSLGWDGADSRDRDPEPFGGENCECSPPSLKYEFNQLNLTSGPGQADPIGSPMVLVHLQV